MSEKKQSKSKLFSLSSPAQSRGFTIVELVASLAIFTILVSGMLGCFAVISKTVKAAREKTILSSLALNYLEIVRNMPYAQIGTIAGNPVGTLPDMSNPYTQTIGGTQYKIYYEVTYVDDPADGTALLGTDVAAADYKQVKMDVVNSFTKQVNSFVTNVVPKGLEGTNNAGALLLEVIDSQGNPVSGADIHITTTTGTPIILDRQTPASGQWVEVGLPALVNGYHVVVSKTGYSSDQTYPITVANPNPIKPDATVQIGHVTKITFAIDTLANLTIRTLNSLCQPLSGVNVNVSGAKLIGTGPPPVLKYNNNYSSVAGAIVLNNIEWDTYTPVLLTGQSFIVYGTSPIQKIDVLPGTSQTYTMILGPNSTANSLLVVVKDAATGAALEGAIVHLRKGGSVPQDYYGTTGGSVWTQLDWSSGGGVSLWSSTTPANYFQDDGNVDANSSPTGLRLKKISGHYVASGWAESSTFDTGTNATTYSILNWEPASQSLNTELKFQVAANNDNATWNYVGPDGTAATYFTTPGTDIGPSLDNKRYVRYKAYLATTQNNKTPVLTSLKLNFVTGCFTPGQVVFPDLTAGNNYDLDVTMTGYQTQTFNNVNINGNQAFQVLMSP